MWSPANTTSSKRTCSVSSCSFYTPPPGWVFVFFSQTLWNSVADKKKTKIHSVQRVWQLLNFWFFQSFFFMASSEFWKAQARNWLSYGRSVLYAAFVSGVHPLRVFDDRTKQRAGMCPLFLPLQTDHDPWTPRNPIYSFIMHFPWDSSYPFFSLCVSLCSKE